MGRMVSRPATSPVVSSIMNTKTAMAMYWATPATWLRAFSKAARNRSKRVIDVLLLARRLRTLPLPVSILLAQPLGFPEHRFTGQAEAVHFVDPLSIGA